MYNHILEYQLPSPENVDVVQITNFSKKGTSFFYSPLIPGDKIKIPKNYCTFTGHPYSYLIKNENSKTLLRIG